MLGNRTKNFQLVPVHGALLYPLDFLMPPIKIIHLHNAISLGIINYLSFSRAIMILQIIAMLVILERCLIPLGFTRWPTRPVLGTAVGRERR